ncbi:M23 family metallopeptidase [Bacillus spizizenii]|uniref:M23 family metallopeptidase n=1 Tax=Bacillus spizizenii TaxID=96241 RepID=A0A9Q4DNE7_BACSC|nr:M23 family metallopeptidase [Bacillus spizizenii]MCY8155566.1 M23 family metallopeptidase [Bacillus spizizenii]MCY8196588.1 M23 family metallopeptidase [Bacillus spizizenii]MCY8219358.1 M23 family metallopeptidase [Bacillus spizizenii]MCY8312964.1 M23 family metallopeptidase [Bacillus spizizenii]
MTNVFDKDTPAKQLLHDVMRKVNALGHEPRVVIELDKVSYVPGMRSKFEVWDRIRSASLEKVQSNAEMTSPLTEEPTTVTSGGESGDRFEYIKCAFNRWAKAYRLPTQAYYFFLAVAKHETAFGTLGQGKPEKGSFIVGYGCPGACDYTYSGIDTQAKFAAKRYADAMGSRFSKINSSNNMTASDIDYFHEGGDKGYGKWVWSADGANWKIRVKQYYDIIRSQALQGSSKWNCKEAGSIGSSTSSSISANTAKKECSTCGEEEVYSIENQGIEIYNSTSDSSKPVFPIEGMSFSGDAKLSSPHGLRGGRMHKGIDITSKSSGSAGVDGRWVVAAWDGTVQRAYKSTSYGNVVMMKHPNGYGTVYAHMKDGSLQVRSGQKIKAGTRIGRVGNTGGSFGSHLHFEVWKNQWVYGGNGHLDGYPILTGAQKIAAGSSGSSTIEKEIVHNIKFNKCFDKNADLSSNWIGKENIKHFTSLTTGERYIGFSGNVKKGQVKDFGYKHNFSADGYYEYAYFANLKDEDSVTVTYDGLVVKRYTKSNNTVKPTYESPIYGKYSVSDQKGVNSHILDFTIDNVSGEAEFGIKCFKVVEVENAYVKESIVARKRDVWLDTGAFVYETTFAIENDITEWEVSTHFDSRVGTARFTLDNKLGTYSPTYTRTTVFPENRRDSDMSYYEQGAVRHVLSEATPVRIYAGYGENLVRVFTGRIKGEIEEDSEASTISINCVDMYDELEEHVFDRILTFPRRDEIHGDEKEPVVMWVKSAIVHNIVNESGLIGWRVVEDDLEYPDAVIEETYYIDIDRGGKTAVVWDSKKREYVKKKISTVKDAYGYKNPYVQAIDFTEGTRASDAIQELIGDLMYRAYCDRYGTFRLENIRNLTAVDAKWEFIDSENLHSLTSSVDHSRVRNHLMIVGSGGQIEHFVDKDLLISTKGKMRTAKVVSEWVDESYGSNARGMKEDIAEKLFFDMKRQARTYNAVVKGNPMIEVLDGAYVYDQTTSTAGYYIVKGNRLVGNKEGMVNFLEMTWQDTDSYYKDKPIYNIPPETSPEDVEGENKVACGQTVKSGNGSSSFTHKVTKAGYVYVEWEMYEAKDRIAIYTGSKKRFALDKPVSHGDGGPIGFYYRPSDGEIKVKINEGGVSYGTGWKYTLYCPGTAPKSVVSKARIV